VAEKVGSICCPLNLAAPIDCITINYATHHDAAPHPPWQLLWPRRCYSTAGPGQGPARLPFTFKFQVLLLLRVSAFNIHLMHSTCCVPWVWVFSGVLEGFYAEGTFVWDEVM